MLKFKKNEIKETASKITGNSELFGDEIVSVIAQLSELSNSANEFGCEFSGIICDCWGNSVDVVAIPNATKSSWEF